MESRQPWLSGSARSIKSPALSPPWLLSPCGAGAGGWGLALQLPCCCRTRAAPLGHILPLWVWGSLSMLLGSLLHALWVPAPEPSLLPLAPPSPHKPCVGALAPHHRAAPSPNPHKMSPTDMILQRKKRTIPRRSMARTLGDPFPLPGTGDAAMAGLGLSSSGVRYRKAGESSGASPR